MINFIMVQLVFDPYKLMASVTIIAIFYFAAIYYIENKWIKNK